ncbi:MAG: M1 family peptidase, partial [Phenylobacterium sp.]|nr:M1 family peptidase [Phenylobacterium sp.]
MKFLAVLAALFLAASSPVWAAPAARPGAAKRVVLPADVRPDRYEIHVAPDAAKLTFDGHVKIALTVVKATDRIVLNAADLTIGKASLSGTDAAPKVVWNEQEQTAAFVFPKAL